MLVTDDNYSEAMEAIAKASYLFVDAETTGLKTWGGARIYGLSVRVPLHCSYYFPYRHQEGNIDRPMTELLELIAQSDYWVAHNAKFEYQMFLAEGVDFTRVKSKPLCTLIGLHLMDENLGDYKLKSSAVRFVDPNADRFEKEFEQILSDNLLEGKQDGFRLPPLLVEPYCCGDTDITEGVYRYIVPKLKHEDLLEVWKGTSEYSMIVGLMEVNGIRIDPDKTFEHSQDAYEKCLQLSIDAREMRGRQINLDSPTQVCTWLGIPSSAAEILDDINTKEAKLVKRYRGFSKANGTYYKVFMRAAVDDIVHCNFRMNGTISGRLSCAGPNLQALPTADDDDDIYKVKECIIPHDSKKVLLSADYSQAEVRLVCHYSQDEILRELIESGENIHTKVSRDTGITRAAAKRLNFSVIYGVGAWTTAEALGISEAEAEKLLTVYHDRYRGFRDVYGASERTARRHRFIKMWSGRRRHYNKGPHATPYHKASSNLIQGGIGELLRIRQTELDRELRSLGVDQILQVHDSAVMEIPEEDVPILVPKIQEIMTDLTSFRIPMPVDIGYGKNMECKEKL